MASSRMASLLRGRAFARARGVARTVAENNVERPVLRVLHTRRALRGGGPRLLHLGDSSLLHISPHDTDRRRLGEMLAAETGTASAQFYGPGYNAALYAEMIRLSEGTPRPACVLVPLCVRATTHLHVTEHPKWGYQRSVETLRGATSAGPGLLRKVVRRAPSPELYGPYDAIERTSRWGLASTVGEYRRALRGYDPGTASDQQRALLFDYFHGEFSDQHRGLEDWRLLGERLAALQVPVVAYRVWMPVQAGERLLGAQFRDHVEHNFRLTEESFFAGLGDGEAVELPPPADELFIDAHDGTEHLNDRGRLGVVRRLAAAVHEARVG